MMTFCALHPQKAVLQPAAFEVIGKFLLYVQGQGLALHDHHIPKRRVLPLDDLIEKRLFLSMAFIELAVYRPVRDHCLRHAVLHSMEPSIFS